MSYRVIIEFLVGVFILLGVAALMLLGYQVSSLSRFDSHASYQVTASFENIGGLKVRAPITMAGVRIGEVSRIDLNPKNFEAEVLLRLDTKYNNIIAENATAKIQTAGLLGSNYIAVLPGYLSTETAPKQDDFLHEGSHITNTQSALILEDMIGQLLYSFKREHKDS